MNLIEHSIFSNYSYRQTQNNLTLLTMRSRLSQYSHLPRIQNIQKQPSGKGQSIYSRKSDYLNIMKYSNQSEISKLLREARNSVQNRLKSEQSLEKQKKEKQQRNKKNQTYLTKKQKKKYYFQTLPTNQNEPTQRQTVKRLTNSVSNCVQVDQIQSMQKPPHRAKMAMCIQADKLYIYGGIGCEPNLKLAVLDLSTKKWTFSQSQKFAQYHPTIPIVGHTFGCYKGRGFIYGGTSNDITNELSIVNLKSLTFTQGSHSQYRRKNHAMIMISKFMIIQGGIESNQVSNSIYYYNTETNTWVYPIVSLTLPYLANHAMTSTYSSKNRKKQINSLSQLTDPIFLFGGQDKKGNMTNQLYKVLIQNDIFVATKIQFALGPSKRIEMCFHSVGNNTLLLYGGKLDRDDEDQPKQNQYHSPVYSFNTQKLQWTNISTLATLPNRYGMASTVSNGKVYVFGGFVGNKYANADITTLSAWNQDLMKSKSNIGTGKILSREKCC